MVPFISPRVLLAFSQWQTAFIFAAFFFPVLLIPPLLFTWGRKRQAEIECERLKHLAESEQRRLSDLIATVPGIVWETRIDPVSHHHTTTFVSDHAEKMLGYTVEEWLSTPNFCIQHVHEEDRERVARECEEILSVSKQGIIYFRWRAKDGRIVWVKAQLAAIVDDKGNTVGTRGVTIDLTEQQLVEHARQQTVENNRMILEALSRNEAQLAAVINSAMDGIITIDEKQNIVLFNAAAEKLFLCSAKEARGGALDRFIPERFRTVHEQYIRDFGKEQGPPRLMGPPREIYGVRASGEEFPIEASISQMELCGQKFFTVILRDITTAKQAVNKLRASEERFAKAFRSNPQPMSLTTLATGTYIDVNESFLAVSGYTRKEVIGHTSLELRIWETPDTRAEFVRQLKEHGALVNYETRLRAKDGSFKVLLSSAETLDINGEMCLLVASSEVTERVAAQNALRDSEERFRSMADTAPVMIWIVGPDRQCTYVNKRVLDFTGRTAEAEMGDGWTEGIHPDDYEGCMEIYESSFAERQPFEMEYRLRRHDGEYRWVYATGIPRFSSDGTFLGYIGSCIDITERKESEVALQTAHEELHQLKNQLEAENIYLQQELQRDEKFGEIVGQSDAIKYVLFKITQVAPTDSTVLITGETGTGKELVARAIHGASPRKDRPLIKVNCGALSPTLIESELFGHEKGAFTGAVGRKQGRFELANGGTIFLDEIGELPPELQVKLLRVIQENEFERLGGGKTMKVDVRIIAATNRNLKQEVEQGLFREDLWYRLNVYPITVPPLRQRKDDIPILVEHFVATYANKFGKTISSVSPRVMQTLQNHSWPGNIRELANVIERAVIHTQGNVLHIVDQFEPVDQSLPTQTLEEVERDYIIQTLENTGWRIEGQYGAAKILGLNPSTLRTRMLKLGIQRRRASVI